MQSRRARSGKGRSTANHRVVEDLRAGFVGNLPADLAKCMNAMFRKLRFELAPSDVTYVFSRRFSPWE